MNKSTYFTQYGAEDYNIFANANKSKSYVLSRFMDDPEGAYFMLFEHVEGCEVSTITCLSVFRSPFQTFRRTF